jgi:hypothetical protein
MRDSLWVANTPAIPAPAGGRQLHSDFCAVFQSARAPAAKGRDRPAQRPFDLVLGVTPEDSQDIRCGGTKCFNEFNLLSGIFSTMHAKERGVPQNSNPYRRSSSRLIHGDRNRSRIWNHKDREDLNGMGKNSSQPRSSRSSWPLRFLSRTHGAMYRKGIPTQ